MINAETLRTLRTRAGLPSRAVAAHLGIGGPTYNRLETGDPDVLRAVTVQAFGALCELLDVHPTELLNQPEQPETQEPTDNVTELIGALHTTKKQVTTADLAQAFGTNAQTIRTLATQADTALQGTGLTVRQRGDNIELAAVTGTDTANSLLHLKTNRNGIDLTAARVLNQALQGQLVAGRQAQNTKAALGTLTKLGWLTHTTSGPKPTQALTYALDI